MEAYEKVLAARAKGRPTAIEYINNIFTDFQELHGDRRYGDDGAIIGSPRADCIRRMASSLVLA